jgi:imidazolonepropionase-like amidohydrolase
MSYRLRPFWSISVCCALCCGVSSARAVAQEETIALRGARLLTITQGVIDTGVLVMSGGRITAIGAQVSIPSDVRVIDVAGRTVMPGLIDGFTNLGAADIPSLGKDDDEATDPVTPHLRITDALNPANRFIPVARNSGITAALCAPAEGNLLAGQSALIRLAGTSIEEMVLTAPVGIHVSLGEAPKTHYGQKGRAPMTRMGAAALLRQTFVNAQAYADKLALYQRKLAAHEADPAEQEPTRPERDLKLEALLPVVQGRQPLIVGADRFDDIYTALKITAEFDLPIILNRGAEAHRLASELAERNIAVIWGPVGASYQELESERGTPATPALLSQAGVQFAFQTGSIDNVAGLLDQARSAIIHGLPYEEALRGLTLYPAQIFGVADRLGSLEVGKLADIVVFDGDPLKELSKVEMVFIGGKRF